MLLMRIKRISNSYVGKDKIRKYKEIMGDVLRWKNKEIEQEIFNKLGIKDEFYVSRSNDRIDNISTFSDEILDGKAKEYYLVILYGVKWNGFSGG